MGQGELSGDAYLTAIYDLAHQHTKIRLLCARCQRTLDVLDFRPMPPGVLSSNLYYPHRTVAAPLAADGTALGPSEFRAPWPQIRKERLARVVRTDRYTCKQHSNSSHCGATHEIIQSDLAHAAVAAATAGEHDLYAVSKRNDSGPATLIPGSQFTPGGLSTPKRKSSRPLWRRAR